MKEIFNDSYLKLSDIESIEYIDNCDIVYDLTIQDNHNYFLNCNNKKVLVHNSGKTLVLTRSIWNRALVAPNSWHLILRATHTSVKLSIFQKTFEDLKRFEPERWSNILLPRSSTIAEFPNGSKVICSGLDDNRIESILGNEFCTVYFNEVSEITFDVVETVLTRLSQVCKYEKNGIEHTLRLLAFFDCNPPRLTHWIYKLFYKGIKPDGSPVSNFNEYGKIKINPVDNKDNLSKKYLQMLQGLSAKKRKRFYDGEYTDNTEGALFKQEWIDDNRCKWDIASKQYILPELEKIVIGLDPATTAKDNSDDTGIVICGSKIINGEQHFYCLKDYTGKYTPKQWADIVINQYNIYKANYVIAEVNQGGDLVTRNIHAENNNIPVKTIHAKKGKELRAEPVANLCERGYVHFYGVLPELEDEITEWVPASGMKSPNRLDSTVYAILYLMENNTQVNKEEHQAYNKNWYLSEKKSLI